MATTHANSLKGKVAIVTGSSKGLGAGIATHFALEGASVVVNYSASKDAADKVVAEIKSNGGIAIILKADMGNPRYSRLTSIPSSARMSKKRWIS